MALRCRIVLAAAEGQSNLGIAAVSGVDVKTVSLWRGRFVETGPAGLWEIAPGRGRKPTYSARKIKAIVQATLLSKPEGLTQWSCRQMAQAQGVSKSTVSNIWRSHNLKPHRLKSFKLSRDARFLEKLTDVVGLYLNPPDQALVLCVDEKTQIQALRRLGTMTHDYKRNGTNCLFAALEVLQVRTFQLRTGERAEGLEHGEIELIDWHGLGVHHRQLPQHLSVRVHDWNRQIARHREVVEFLRVQRQTATLSSQWCSSPASTSSQGVLTVSYTHLTLPTILRV